MKTRIGQLSLLAATMLGLGACGGSGGGSSPPPPPPPPAGVTFTAELTVLNMTDLRTNTPVSSTGLPVAGAVATRQ